MAIRLATNGAAVAPPRSQRRGRRWLGLAVGEAAMWSIAAVAFAVVGWSVADAWLYQQRAEALLAIPADGGMLPASRAPVTAGTPIARLTVPRLGISSVVAEGVSEPVLRRAIGRVPSSARPGESGNIALAGHRDTYLRPLADIRAGDQVFLETAAGRDLYEVEWTEVVDPADIHVMADTSYPALTLVTCYPFRYVGPAPLRFVVRAKRLATSPL